jgi:hypothetical protein
MESFGGRINAANKQLERVIGSERTGTAPGPNAAGEDDDAAGLKGALTTKRQNFAPISTAGQSPINPDRIGVAPSLCWSMTFSENRFPPSGML